jgi:DNA-binding response OmpR family regulator
MLLEERGAEVQIFGDELSLLTAIARRPPTAIFLDVVLQWVDGLALCVEIRRRPPGDAVPVIVMSGLQWPNLEARAREAGATAFLAKPFEREALMRVLGPPSGPTELASSPGNLVESGLHAS